MFKKKTIVIVSTIMFVIFCIDVFLIFRAYKNSDVVQKNGAINHIEENTQKQSNNENTVQTSGDEVKKVTPSAKIEMTQYFNECGHVTTEELKVPRAIVNMTENEVKDYYKGWNVRFFSDSQIKLYKANEGRCNEHYIIKDVNGYVNVFILNKNNEEVLYRATDILTKYLSNVDRQNLEKGVRVIGKDNLETVIQDFQ